MPSYEFSVEILPNLWIGTKHALRDATFRKHTYIIRDVIFDSAFSSPTEPILTTNTAIVKRIPITGQENQIQQKEIENLLYPFLDESLEKDRGLLISGESWNSPHILYVIKWCASRSGMDYSTAEFHIKNHIPNSAI